MGNTAIAGHALNFCGCTDGSFESSAKFIISINGIEAWNARALIKDNLRKQSELARRSPLRFVPVKDGLSFISAKVSGLFRTISRDQFVRLCMDLLHVKAVQHGPRDRDDLYDIYDSMDFDRSGTLSLGEWAGGLSVFFQGDTSQCVKAVFSALDTDGSDAISKKELHEYLKPFVKAMTPVSADALRPILLKKATDDIYKEMDMDDQNDISSDEMLEWTRRGNNIVDRLADIIDGEVYKICLAERERKNRLGIATGGWSIPGLSLQYPLPGMQLQDGGVVDAYSNQAYPPASAATRGPSPPEWSAAQPPAQGPWDQEAVRGQGQGNHFPDHGQDNRGWGGPPSWQQQQHQYQQQPMQPPQAPQAPLQQQQQLPPQQPQPPQQQQQQHWQAPQGHGYGGYHGGSHPTEPPCPDSHPGARYSAYGPCPGPSAGGTPSKEHCGGFHDPFQGGHDSCRVPPPPPPPARAGYGAQSPPQSQGPPGPPSQHTVDGSYPGRGGYDARPPAGYGAPHNDARPPTVPYGGASPYGPGNGGCVGGYGGY